MNGFQIAKLFIKAAIVDRRLPDTARPKVDQVITRDLKRCAPYRIVRDNPDLYKIVNPLQLTFHFDRRPRSSVAMSAGRKHEHPVVSVQHIEDDLSGVK